MTGSIGHEWVEFAATRLIDHGDGWWALVRDMVARWPEADPVDLVLVLVEAAAAIEANFRQHARAHDGATHGYRLAALLALDIHAAARLGLRNGRAADLAAYWRIDGYSLHL